MDAHVFFVTSKRVPLEDRRNRNIGMLCASLRLSNRASDNTQKVIAVDLMTEQYHEQFAEGMEMFSLDFQMGAEKGFGGMFFPRDGSMSAEEIVNSLDAVYLTVTFLPRETEIIRGTVSLRVNSTLKKSFDIPAQKIGAWSTIVNPIDLKPSDPPAE